MRYAILCFLAILIGPAQGSESGYRASALTFKRAFHPKPDFLRVIDGDTIVYRDTHYRLLGLDTPELHIPCERARGLAAKNRLQELLREPPNRVLIKPATHLDKFGRVIAIVRSNNRNVADLLIGEGMAHPYDGGKRAPWC